MFSASSDPGPAVLRGTAEEALSALATLDAGEVPEADLADHLPALYRLKAIIDATIIDTVGVFDGRKQWAHDGAFTAGGWISARTGTTRASASTTVTTARQARHMPVAMDHARHGDLSADQVRVLAAARGVSEATAKEYDSDEVRLVDAVASRPVETAARVLRRWAAVADPDAAEESHADRDAKRKVNLSTSLEGMAFLDGLLTSEANAVLRAQLEAITEDLHRWGLSRNPDGTRLTAAQLRHDALIEMARRAGSSATAVHVRRNAKARAQAAAMDRDTDTETGTDETGTGTGIDGQADTGRASTGEADHQSDPSDPHPDGAPHDGGDEDQARGPDHNRGPASVRPTDLDDHPGHPDPDHDPESHGPGGCCGQTAARGLLLPPGTGPPGCGPPGGGEPDDKVAGGLGRPLFTVLIDLATLEDREPTDLLTSRAEVPGVGPLPTHAIRRHLCDAGISRVVTHGASLPLDVGAVSRTATPAQRRALITHSDTCEFPGCTAPWEWCEAHHLDHWTRTHRTALDDLALECTGHHHQLHQPGWTMTRNPDLTTTVTRPDGTTLEPIPP